MVSYDACLNRPAGGLFGGHLSGQASKEVVQGMLLHGWQLSAYYEADKCATNSLCTVSMIMGLAIVAVQLAGHTRHVFGATQSNYGVRRAKHPER